MANETGAADGWRRCSSCKGTIDFDDQYYVCSVSTCNRRATNFAFCSVECWDAHLSTIPHRDSWAEERRAPPLPASARKPATGDAGPREPRRILVSTPGASGTGSASKNSAPREVLIIASRLKDYVRARSGYNTSDSVLDPLSELVRRAIDDAIDAARREGRKTVLDRDVAAS
jgi:hypothetical protein